ncbi:MerR family transcriptional regulator [Candidatus Latescibacterota bacterium]
MTDIGHSIKVASLRTGLSPHVLRVWERRYEAVVPSRTPTKHRIYSDGDIERLHLLHQATKGGHSIGQIAHLPTEALSELVKQDMGGTPLPTSSPPPQSREPQEYVEACLRSARNLRADEIEAQLAEAAIDLPRIALIEQVLDPLMQRIGDLWEEGALHVSEEHLTSAVVRSFVGSLVETQRAPEGAPGIVVTTPARQVHEIGALLAAGTAISGGWRVAYLGGDLPADEIAGAVRRFDASAVALSIVYPSDDPLLGSELQRLRRGLGEEIVLLVGGRVSGAYADDLARVGAVHVGDLADLRQKLAALRSTGASGS